MEVTKRNGLREQVRFDKITQRLAALCNNVHEPYAKRPAYGHFKQSKQLRDHSPQVTGAPLVHADPVKIVQRVSVSLYDGVTTKEIDVLSAEVAESLKTLHPEYGILAARIVISNLHKSTPKTLRESVELLGPGRWAEDLYLSLMTNQDLCNTLEDAMDHARSYAFDYFAAKTLIKGYLLSKDGEPIEKPQHMWMRVALSLHGPNDLPRVLESYNLLSCGYFTHASPTLFNAGTNHQQNSSCFLLGMGEDQDSIEGIFDTLKNCALISKWGGGLGVHVHSIRSNGADIRGTNGKATGLVPMLKNFDALARYVNQVRVFSLIDVRDMTVDLRLRLHRFKYAPFLYHLSLQAKSKDGRETIVMEHFPELDPTNTDPHILNLVGLKSKSDPTPSFEVCFEAHPDHTIETLARYSKSRSRLYWFLFNDCRTHSFAVIKHALNPPPDSIVRTQKVRKHALDFREAVDFWRFDK